MKRFSMKHSFFVPLFLLLATQCGKTGDISSSESHFLSFLGPCSDDSYCESGFECVCGLCTQPCDSNRDCSSLDGSAECLGHDNGSCETEEVCDVTCSGDADCRDLGDLYQCQSGRCRLGAVLGSNDASGDNGSGGTGGAAPGTGGSSTVGGTPPGAGGSFAAGGTAPGAGGSFAPGGTGAPRESGDPNVVGELDGEAIDITADDGALGFGAGGSSDPNGWTTSVAIGASATMYLWSDGESIQGILEIAPGDPSALEWVCLGDVEISADGMGWSSSNLSRLGSCDLNDGLSFDLAFSEQSGVTQGTFGDETIDWDNYGSGSRAGYSDFNFKLDTGERAALGLHLADETFFGSGDADIAFARLVVVGAEGAAACGGSGVISGGPIVSIDIDEFSPLRSCPGQAVDGELSGRL